jgi:pantetheine-phosphate adenylyltransferase
MKKSALFPGSFDPFTKGHENLVEKAYSLFDEIIIGIGINSTKTSYYTLESRVKHIQSLFQDKEKIKVLPYQKLSVEFCQEIGANYILRGLRDVKDFEYERSIALMNHEINSSIETIFLITDPIYNHINSSIIREIAKNGGIIDKFVTNDDFLVKQ